MGYYFAASGNKVESTEDASEGSHEECFIECGGVDGERDKVGYYDDACAYNEGDIVGYGGFGFSRYVIGKDDSSDEVGHENGFDNECLEDDHGEVKPCHLMECEESGGTYDDTLCG